MTNVNTAALRELPFSPYLVSERPSATEWHTWTAYTADQMRAYAQPYADRLAALEAGMRGLVERWTVEADCMLHGVNGAENAVLTRQKREMRDELSALLNRPADGGG